MGTSLRPTRVLTDMQESHPRVRQDHVNLDRVIIVSNRLPTTVRLDRGGLQLDPSSGGLATGLRHLQAGSPRPWIGWSGLGVRLPPGMQRDVDTRLAQTSARGVPLSEAEVASYYHRFANGLLWPVLHGRPADEPFEPGDWQTYRAVNARFAETVLDELTSDDLVWIHDYHLLLLPRMLRRRRPDVRVGFFLHTPFPDLAAWASIPESEALLDGMLGADVVGFQTRAHVEHFAEAVRVQLGRRVELASGTGIAPDGERSVSLYFSPMSVDFGKLSSLAADHETARRAAALRRTGGPLFVGVDRLDPTKGIPERLEAFGRLLELRPELHGRARLIQLAVPSREEVPSYRRLRERVEALVRSLNARFASPSWTPVAYTYGTLRESELVALYRAADVMLVTSLNDGMNLVAKEFVAARTDEQGVLVLSRRAGAADDLTAALLVDPTAPDDLSEAYTRALDMSVAERRVRMRRLRATVAGHDVNHWARHCLSQLDPGFQRSAYPGG